MQFFINVFLMTLSRKIIVHKPTLQTTNLVFFKFNFNLFFWGALSFWHMYCFCSDLLHSLQFTFVDIHFLLGESSSLFTLFLQQVWSSKYENCLQVFLEQLSNENLVDVTLSCQGQFLKAHKMILSACSPYFQVSFRAK